MAKNKYLFNLFRGLVKLSFLIPFILLKTMFKLVNNASRWLLKRLHFSITFKITTVYSVIFILILSLMTLGLWGGFLAFLGMNAEDNMKKDFQIVLSYMDNSAELPKKDLDSLSDLKNTTISIFDDHKKLLYSTQKNGSPVIFHDKGNSRDFTKIHGNFMLDINPQGTTKNHDVNQPYIFSLSLNDQVKWKNQPVYIQLTNNLSKEYYLGTHLIFGLLIINFIFILLTMLIGSKASKKMLMPIENMTKTVKNININALATRLDIGGSQDELKDLAETFNHMLDRIQLSYEQQNQFVSDASHELRTPISVIQGYVNLLDRWGKNDKAVLDEAIGAIKTESESMKKLIESLLFLARGDKNTQIIEKENFYINELIDEIVKETKLFDASHEIFSEHNGSLTVHGDRKLLKEALRIFMDNSIKYTPRGGSITISCFPLSHQVLIEVKDTGLGISKEDLPHIFNRFYRADKSRTKETGGTGLGLSIAQWIILNHKGTINITSEINRGTKVSIFLPISS